MRFPKRFASGRKERRVRACLRERARAGDRYFKSRDLAGEVGLSPNEVGALLAKLRASEAAVDIEKWSNGTPVTWHIVSLPEVDSVPVVR